MPKQKSHKGAAARFKVTGTGKIRRRRVGLNHFLGKKTSSRKRKLGSSTVVAKADRKRVRRMLGE